MKESVSPFQIPAVPEVILYECKRFLTLWYDAEIKASKGVYEIISEAGDVLGVVRVLALDELSSKVEVCPYGNSPIVEELVQYLYREFFSSFGEEVPR